MNSFNSVKDGVEQLNKIEKQSCKNCVHFIACKMMFTSAFPKERGHEHIFKNACRLFKHIKNYAEVVLCGDCEKYDPKTKMCEEFVSKPLPTGGRYVFLFEPDNFCCFGVRKEGAENGKL